MRVLLCTRCSKKIEYHRGKPPRFCEECRREHYRLYQAEYYKRNREEINRKRKRKYRLKKENAG